MRTTRPGRKASALAELAVRRKNIMSPQQPTNAGSVRARRIRRRRHDRRVARVRRGGEPLLCCLPGAHWRPGRWRFIPRRWPGRAAAKTLLQIALRFGLKPGLEKSNFRSRGNDAFANFLSETAGLPRRDLA